MGPRSMKRVQEREVSNVKQKYLFIVVALAVLLAWAPNASAQTATITGRVTDSTEAVIPGTKITVIN